MVAQGIAFSAVLSTLFCLFKWLFSLIGVSNPPTWSSFLWGGVALLVVFIIMFVWRFIGIYRNYQKDITFSLMSDYYGVTWGEYKKLYRRLQSCAREYDFEFYRYVREEASAGNVFMISPSDENYGDIPKDYIPIFAKPQIGIPSYYIKLNSLFDEKTAIELFVDGFISEMRERGKL